MSRKTKQSAILPNRMQKKSLSHLDSSSSLHSWIRQFSLIHANCISPSCNTLLSLPPFALPSLCCTQNRNSSIECSFKGH